MKQRIVTGLVAGIGFGLVLILGGVYFSVLLLMMAAVGFYEFSRMNSFPPLRLAGLIGILSTLYIVFPWDSYPQWDALTRETTLWLALFLLFAVTVISKNRVQIDQIALLVLAIAYIGYGFHFMITTRLGDHGLYWSLATFVSIWASDSGAYFSGRKFGKRKLWPEISPKKTVEGAIGGIILAVIAALCFSLFAPELLSWSRAILFGAVISVVGQMGDLIQSAYKRVRGIKDTGSILPGHGGILDRCDSWLIVFPFLQLLSLIPQ